MENIKQQTVKLLNFPTDAVGKMPLQNLYMKCAWQANLKARGIGMRQNYLVEEYPIKGAILAMEEDVSSSFLLLLLNVSAE